MRLTVIDANDVDYLSRGDQFRASVCDWLMAHGIDHLITHRVELHLIDTLFMRVFQYDTDQRGRVRWDRGTDTVARRAPIDVLVRSDPPFDYREVA